MSRDISTTLDMTKKPKAYARAGVDVDLGNRLKKRIRRLVRQTHGPEVLGKIGGFGGLFSPDFSGMREPVLVASIDGVGTKLKVAFAMDRHDTVGVDLVNHCVNDIAALGARPLFFLDYIGARKLERRVFDQLIRGFSRACRAAGCALIGGETAQMPGIYRQGEYDLAGCIVGVVERAKIIDGSRIKAGDVILGLASNGLHTNGYSLARKIFFEKLKLKPESRVAELGNTIGDELLKVHVSYGPLVQALTGSFRKDSVAASRESAAASTERRSAAFSRTPPQRVKAFAHITGGGIPGNVVRVLPDPPMQSFEPLRHES
jgi:phosphoribosylformylglycinamidine cyclo-ligase